MIMNKQFIPLLLTGITFFVLVAILFFFIQFLNFFPTHDKISSSFVIADILVGLTIYIKTSVDFAVFIGNLLKKYPGIKNRIGIEIGTAFGNGIGTFFVLGIWTFFKEVPILMIFMIFLASLVLLHLSEEGLREFLEQNKNTFLKKIFTILKTINSFTYLFLQAIVPKIKTTNNAKTAFLSLFFFAVSVPLVLGLDDFAGYIPLFRIVNVFGFAIGVFLGHMLLTSLIFLSPTTTVKIVKQPFIVLLGSIAFIVIAILGFGEILISLQKLL